MVNTLTLNPAIDRVLYLDVLDKNITNRIRDMADTIGGKGTHVSINLKILGDQSRAFGISYGELGRRIIECLEEYNLEVEFVYRAEKNSRMNYLLVEENNDCTIIAERGVILENEDLEDVLSRLKQKIQKGDSLILSGDASNSPDPLVYNVILEELKSKNLKVFIDTSGTTLLQCIKTAPYLIKPNLDELSLLCGREVSSAEEDVISAVQSIGSYGVEIIAVSMGAEGSVVKSPEGIFKSKPPKVTVRNTIGCGDSFLAGLIFGIDTGVSIEDTLKYATAVSAATAESSLSVGFDKKRADELMSSCAVERIG